MRNQRPRHLSLSPAERKALESHRWSLVFVFLSLVIAAISVTQSLLNDNWTWFQRSGAVITVLGLAHIQRFGRINPRAKKQIEKRFKPEDQAELDNLFDVCRASIQDRASFVAAGI